MDWHWHKEYTIGVRRRVEIHVRKKVVSHILTSQLAWNQLKLVMMKSCLLVISGCMPRTTQYVSK